MITIYTWLGKTESILKAHKIETPRLDCIVLLEDATRKDRAWLLAHSEHVLSVSDVKKLDGFIARRITHEPLAYIRGKTEFYGREFDVDKRVLVPRPESEAMVELLTELVQNDLILNQVQDGRTQRPLIVIDIGTGSGCLAITAKLELPKATVIATDISSQALSVARKNANNLGASITFEYADLLPTANGQPPTVIIANLPYVPMNYPVNKATTHEPAVALFAEDNGLRIYAQLFGQIARTSSEPRFLITESLPAQHTSLTKLAAQHGFHLEKIQGLAQLFICVD